MNPQYIYETAVYDGGLKYWRILNLTTGSVYSMPFDSEAEALLVIEDGQQRANKTVKRVKLSSLHGLLSGQELT